MKIYHQNALEAKSTIVIYLLLVKQNYDCTIHSTEFVLCFYFSEILRSVRSNIALTHCMEFIIVIRLLFKIISGLTNVLLKSFIWKEVNIQSQ